MPAMSFLLALLLQQAFFTSPLPAAELQNKQAVLETTYGTIVIDLLADRLRRERL